MDIRYFVVGASGRLRKASRADVEALWDGSREATALGCPAGDEARLVSVFRDADLQPVKVFLLRLPLADGRCTRATRRALRRSARPDGGTPGELVRHHTGGWPADFFPQLAVALDVPVAALDVPLGIGGPLLAAAARSVTPRRALRYFR